MKAWFLRKLDLLVDSICRGIAIGVVILIVIYYLGR